MKSKTLRASYACLFFVTTFCGLRSFTSCSCFCSHFFFFFFFFLVLFSLAPQAKKRTVWENNLRKVYDLFALKLALLMFFSQQVATIETLEDFWGVMNKVAPAGKVCFLC